MTKKYVPPAIRDLGGTFEQATGYTPVGKCSGGLRNVGGNCQNGNQHTGAGACITGSNNTGGGSCRGGRKNTKA